MPEKKDPLSITTPQCDELRFYQEHPGAKSQVFQKLFLIIQADFPELANQYEDDIFNIDGSLRESGHLQNFYNEKKKEIFQFLKPFLEQAYSYLLYCYETLSKGEDYDKLYLEKDFKIALDHVFQKVIEKEDIRSLYRYAQFKEIESQGRNIPKKIYELKRKESEVAPLLALMLVEVYSLIDRLSPATEALLTMQNNSTKVNLFDLKTSELSHFLNFPIDLSPRVADLTERIYAIRELILDEHARLSQMFQYDIKEGKYYFVVKSAEGVQKIFLKFICIRLKSVESMIRKIFHTIFNPEEQDLNKQNINITDYIGIMFEIEETKDRELLIQYLRESEIFNAQRQSTLIKVSNSIHKQVASIFEEKENAVSLNKEGLDERQWREWVLLKETINYKLKVNPSSVDDYSVTSFKSKLFYNKSQADGFVGEEIFIVTPEEKENYNKSHIPFRIEQITKFIFRFAGLSDIFFRKSLRKQK